MTELSPVYLDHHATTPVDPRVAQVVVHVMTEVFGNPNSVDHLFGQAAADVIQGAARSVASLIGAEADDIHFTSGSTEAIRIGLTHLTNHASRRLLRIGVTRVEHNAVLDAVTTLEQHGAAEVRWIDVDQRAALRPDSFHDVLHSGVDVVCVMAANNEVGTIYPVEQLAQRAHAAGAAIFVDATQAAGRLPLRVRDWCLDYLVLSAHKMYGPKGVGALVAAAQKGGADPSFTPPGTPNVPGIAGFGEACRLRQLEMAEDEPRIAQLRNRLESSLCAVVSALVVNGDREHRLSHNLHVSAPGVPNDAVVGRLRRTVAISTGAACTSGAHAPSHVLHAMGLSDDVQEGALRIGLGKFNTLEEIDWAATQIAAAIESVRNAMRNTV